MPFRLSHSPVEARCVGFGEVPDAVVLGSVFAVIVFLDLQIADTRFWQTDDHRVQMLPEELVSQGANTLDCNLRTCANLLQGKGANAICYHYRCIYFIRACKVRMLLCSASFSHLLIQVYPINFPKTNSQR